MKSPTRGFLPSLRTQARNRGKRKGVRVQIPPRPRETTDGPRTQKARTGAVSLLSPGGTIPRTPRCEALRASRIWDGSEPQPGSRRRRRSQALRAEGVGFEPTRSVTRPSNFQDCRHRPLGEPSSGTNSTAAGRLVLHQWLIGPEGRKRRLPTPPESGKRRRFLG